MTPPLPAAFTAGPIAHRALHGPGRAENSMGAVDAALAAGVAIEVDVQRSADGVAMVFHDHDLERLTGRAGKVHALSAEALGRIDLVGGGGPIPTLAEVLARVSGRVPLLIEVKDQDGALGEDVGPLEEAVARDLAGYGGAAAVMSFNPHSVAALARAVPAVPRGLVTSDYDPEDWPELPAEVRDRLREIPDVDRVGAAFISHDVAALGMPRVAELAARMPVLCWTVRSREQEAEARRVAASVTFEGYLPEGMPTPSAGA